MGIIKDTSVMKTISRSFENGVLYYYRDPETGSGDIASISKILNSYWKAVSIVFKEDWDKTSKGNKANSWSWNNFTWRFDGFNL